MPALQEAKTRLKFRLTSFKLVTLISAHTADYSPWVSAQNHIHTGKQNSIFKPDAVDLLCPPSQQSLLGLQVVAPCGPKAPFSIVCVLVRVFDYFSDQSVPNTQRQLCLHPMEVSVQVAFTK